MTSLSLLGLKALIHYQTPCLRFNCIHHSSAPALSDSQLHPGLCTASFGGEVKCAQFHEKHSAHQFKHLLPHRYSPYLPSPSGESTEGPDIFGFMPRLDLGATNFQFNVQSVGVLDLGCLQARGL